MEESSEIVSLTRDIIAAVRQFEGLLREEASVLEQSTQDGLIEIAERKTRYADHLDLLVKRRAKLLTALGVIEGNEAELVTVLHSNDQARQVTRDWNEAVARLHQCNRGAVGVVIVGDNHSAVTGADAVVHEVVAHGRGQHHAGNVVARKRKRAFDGPGCGDDLGRTDAPQAVARASDAPTRRKICRSKARPACRIERHPVKSISTAPQIAATTMGTTENAESSTMAAKIATAIRALRDCGTASAECSSSSRS